jgi:hypothetical protein
MVTLTFVPSASRLPGLRLCLITLADLVCLPLTLPSLQPPFLNFLRVTGSERPFSLGTTQRRAAVGGGADTPGGTVEGGGGGGGVAMVG